jgi:malic enzyme
VATGTAFEPVVHAGRTHVIGQANNVFIFPGMGLGCLLAEAREIPDSLFLAAARRLAACVRQDRLDCGAIYPSQADLRAVSAEVAAAVAEKVEREQHGRATSPDDIRQAVAAAMWNPEYVAYG